MITREMFDQFKRVSEDGTPNLADPRVQKRSGLSEDIFSKILANRSALEAQFADTKLEPQPITNPEVSSAEETEEEEPEPEPEEPEEEVEED